MYRNDKNIAQIALALVLFLAPMAGYAQSPDFDGLLNVAYEESSKTVGSEHFELCRQTGDDTVIREPLSSDWYDAIAPAFARRIDLILADPTIAFVADAVTEAGGRKPEIVLSHTVRTAHFNHRFVVLGFDNFNPRGAGERVDPQRIDEALRVTAVHELAHFLQYRLYGAWLPRVNYTGSEFSASGADGGHWFQKPTNEASAWCEGFAEAVAATLIHDARISHFEGRKVLHYGVKKPRSESELGRIEGYVACCLRDFWAGEGQAARMKRSFAVIRGDRPGANRHTSFSAYLSDHLRRFPEDAPRWELALRANTACRRGLSAMNASAVFQRLAEEVEVDLLARACFEVLADAAPEASRNELLQAVVSEARGLREQGERAYDPLGAERETFERMGKDELRAAVERAEQAYRGWFQKYGYDFHPSCKEAKEQWNALLAILKGRA